MMLGYSFPSIGPLRPLSTILMSLPGSPVTRGDPAKGGATIPDPPNFSPFPSDPWQDEQSDLKLSAPFNTKALPASSRFSVLTFTASEVVRCPRVSCAAWYT